MALDVAKIRDAVETDASDDVLNGWGAVASGTISSFAPDAPEGVADAAALRMISYWNGTPASRISGERDDTYSVNYGANPMGALYASGAADMCGPWRSIRLAAV